jgi:class 3 adenylate cyclase
MGEIRDFRLNRSGNPPRQSAPRRLAAIVAGDISGYSRLVQIDEEGTHGRVKRIERELIGPSILEHHGRLVKTTGDRFIAIFDSPVAAARCGILIRQSMVERNASLPKHHWIEYRIGVNLGDVITEANDVYGDGVNIASCLAAIAGPDQVCISDGMYELIKHKLVCGYQSLGDRKVKNITDPVRVYRVLPDPDAFHRTREYSDLSTEPHFAGYRNRNDLVLVWATTPQIRRGSVRRGFTRDADDDLVTPVYHEASNAVTIALTSETLSSQLRSATSGQIRSDCMIWAAASISGWRTAGTRSHHVCDVCCSKDATCGMTASHGGHSLKHHVR